MERRKASPEQLIMLLRILEDDKELAIGKFTSLEGRIRQTNTWIKITEKLNASSGFSSGAIKTPDKWQQTWRDWKSNVKKKAFKIRKNRFTPGSNSNIQLTEAEEKILRLICTNTAAFGLADVPETSTVNKNTIVTESHNTNNDMNETESTANGMKWVTEPHSFSQADLDLGLVDSVINETNGMESTGIPTTTLPERPLWKRGRPVRLVHDKLLNLEEERIKIEKQKLLEKKRCNNVRIKIEKDRLEIERQRNVLLEKLLVAVEMVAHQ